MDARSYAPLIEPIERAGRIALRLEAEDWLIAGNMKHQVAEDCVRSKRKPDSGVEPNDLRVTIPAGVADIAISARRSARCRIVRFGRYRDNPFSLPFAVAEPHPCGGKAHERAVVRRKPRMLPEAERHPALSAVGQSGLYCQPRAINAETLHC